MNIYVATVADVFGAERRMTVEAVSMRAALKLIILEEGEVFRSIIRI